MHNKLKRRICIFCVVHLIMLFALQFGFGQETKDSLWLVWEDKQQEDTVRLNALETYINDYYMFNYPDSSYQFYSEHLALAKQINDSARIAYGYLGLGVACQLEGDYDCAIENLTRSKAIYTAIEDRKYFLYPNQNLADIYRTLGKPNEAIELYKESDSLAQVYQLWKDEIMIKISLTTLSNEKAQFRNSLMLIGQIDSIAQQHQDNLEKYRQLSIYENKADTYQDMKKWEDAIKYLELSAELNQELDYRPYAVHNYLSLGEISVKLKDTIRSNHYFEKAYKLSKTLDNNYVAVVAGHYAKANESSNKGQNYLALRHLDSCLLAAKNGQMGHWYPTIYTAKGQVLLEEKKYQEALEICKQGLSYSEQYDVIEEKEDCLSCMATCYEELGQPVLALNYFKKSQLLKDSLSNEDKTHDLATLEAENYFAIERRETEYEHQQNLQSARVMRNSIIGGSSGILAIAALTFLSILQRRKRKSAQKEQQLQERFSKDLLENTEQERSRIAGDLHDSVNHKLLVLKQKASSGDIVQSDEIATVIHQVREISHNLSPAQFEQVGLTKSVEDLCQNTMNVSPIQIATQINYDDQLSTKTELQIYRIVEESLNNIVKHSCASHAIIQIEEQNGQFNLSIKDNGKGMSPDLIKGKKTSFGLNSMKQRAKVINGKLQLIPTKKGSQIQLQIQQV